MDGKKMGRAFQGRIKDRKIIPKAHPLLARMTNHDRTIAALAEEQNLPDQLELHDESIIIIDNGE